MGGGARWLELAVDTRVAAFRATGAMGQEAERHHFVAIKIET
jgi:hypothetical protein